HVFSMD
ncbi:hypothetical protein ECEC1864_2414, partial [Escherichia coli EC1864]